MLILWKKILDVIIIILYSIYYFNIRLLIVNKVAFEKQWVDIDGFKIRD